MGNLAATSCLVQVVDHEGNVAIQFHPYPQLSHFRSAPLQWGPYLVNCLLNRGRVHIPPRARRCTMFKDCFISEGLCGQMSLRPSDEGDDLFESLRGVSLYVHTDDATHSRVVPRLVARARFMKSKCKPYWPLIISCLVAFSSLARHGSARSWRSDVSGVLRRSTTSQGPS